MPNQQNTSSTTTATTTTAPMRILPPKVRTGGKGTPRRIIKSGASKSTSAAKSTTTNSSNSDNTAAASVAAEKRAISSLKKLRPQVIPMIEECNMFMGEGQVLNIPAPSVHACINSNTFVISGKQSRVRPLDEMIPEGILNQIGNDEMSKLQTMIQQMMQQQQQAKGGEVEEGATGETTGDDDVPELETFEQPE